MNYLKNIFFNFLSKDQRTKVFFLICMVFFPIHFFINNNISYNTNFQITENIYSEQDFNKNNYQSIDFNTLKNSLKESEGNKFSLFKNKQGIFLTNYFSDINLENYKNELTFFKDNNNNIAITNNKNKLIYYRYKGEKGEIPNLNKNVPMIESDRNYYISKNGIIYYLYNEKNNKYTYINGYKFLEITKKVISTAKDYDDLNQRKIFSIILLLSLLFLHFGIIYFNKRKEKNKKDIAKAIFEDLFSFVLIFIVIIVFKIFFL